MAMAAAACIGRGRKAEERRTPHASPNSNAEGERQREEQQQKLGRKEKNLEGWMGGRKERKGVLGRISQEQCCLCLPSACADAERSFEKNNLAICGICYALRRPSPALARRYSPRSAKSETIKRGEICGVKRKGGRSERRRRPLGRESLNYAENLSLYTCHV